MDQFGLFRQAFDAVLNHLAEHIGEHDHLERLERLYYNNNMPLDLSTLNGHIATGRTNEPPYTLKFDTKEFLEAFATSEDGVIRRHVNDALESLGRLANAPLGSKQEPSPMGFAWSPPIHWFDECGPLATKDAKIFKSHQKKLLNTLLDDRGALLPGWEPLQALVNFDRAWQESQIKNEAQREIWEDRIPWANCTSEDLLRNWSDRWRVLNREKEKKKSALDGSN